MKGTTRAGWRRRRLAWVAGLAFAAAHPSPAGAEDAPEPALPTVGHLIELPPFLVQETEKHSPWLYGRMPGFEILSRCPEDATNRFVEKVYHAHQLFNALLPPDLHPPMSAPTTYLIYSDDMKQAVPPEVLQAMGRVNVVPNFMLTDEDELEVVALVPRYNIRHSENMVLTPGSIRYLMGRRVPAPPTWFMEGFSSLYEEIEYDTDRIRIGPALWVSDAITKSIQENAEFPRQLLPMAELFSPYRTAQTRLDGGFLDVWRSQSALFIRWALDRTASGGPAALWKFVGGASAGPVSEDFFHECFGLNYADMLDGLADYLPLAVNRSLEIRPGNLPEMPEFELRRATDAEVSRITGEWERLEVSYVKSRFPPLVGRYVDQARLTVRAAYNRGERDPGLLAVMGLDALDAGETSQARDFLESAVRAGVLRPRIYYELGRLRYAQARLIPMGVGGRLSGSQAATVLDALDRGRRLGPPLLESYELAGEVWFDTSAPATPAQWAVLEEGVRLFPWNFPLLAKVTAIGARQGRLAEAAALVAYGLERAPRGPVRDRLLQMRAILAPYAAPSH